MERFLRHNPPAASKSKLANITAVERAKKYKELYTIKLLNYLRVPYFTVGYRLGLHKVHSRDSKGVPLGGSKWTFTSPM